jgi:hypothetical protein
MNRNAAPLPSNRSTGREAAPRSGVRKVVIGNRVSPYRRNLTASDLAALISAVNSNQGNAVRSSNSSYPARFAVDQHWVAQVEENPAARSQRANNVERQPNPPSENDDEKQSPEIIVYVTPNGLVISSEDEQALDEFEALIRDLTEYAGTPGTEYTVFYLKYAQAAEAATLLMQLVTGVAPDEGGSSGLVGGLAQAALGNVAGGLVGGLLSGSGSSTSTYSSVGLSIVPESRLNALVVQGSPAQLDMVEQLLKVIDQESSPELVQTTPPPRLIPVEHTSAENIATQVRAIFAQQIAAGSGQQRQPNPEDFIRALRGDGGSSRGGRGGRNEQAQQQMTISVDTRSNSLVVAAPEPLFQSVKALVEVLDQEGLESPQTTQVVSISGANSTVIKQALTAALGDVIQTTTPGSTSSTGRSSGGNTDQGSDGSRVSNFDDFRRRAEMFNALRGGSSFGGSPFGGGFSGRSFGGFGGFGDRGGDRDRGRGRD